MSLLPIRKYEIREEHFGNGVPVAPTIPVDWIREHCKAGDVLVLSEDTDADRLVLERHTRSNGTGDSVQS
jgi:hypothetical protein